MSRTRLGVAAVLATLALTGCGSDSDSGSSPKDDSSSDTNSAAPTASPASGDRIEGEGFSFAAPEGWKELDPDSVPSFNFLALANDPDDTEDGFADNINVLEDPTLLRAKGSDEIEDSIEKVLGGLSDDVEIADQSSLDGEEAVVAYAGLTQGKLKYRTVQYVAVHDGKGYVMTVSFSEDRPAEEREEVAASIAATWSWSS